MNIKQVLTGSASKKETQRFWYGMETLGFLLLSIVLIGARWYSNNPGNFLFVAVIGLGASVAAFFMAPNVPRALDIALIAIPIAYAFLTWGFIELLILFPAFRLLQHLMTSKNGSHSDLSDSHQSAAPRSGGNSDAVLYTSIAGAAAVGLSLLALPWFALESFDWNDSVNITFNNLRDVYNYARDNGFDGDVRFFYLEWGYIVSYAAAIFAAVSALRIRDGKSTVSRPLLNVAIGATCLVGLWQGAIATALTQLDDDGSVQFGVWLGVVGHVAIVVSFVMMRQMMNRPSVSSPGSNLPY